MSKDMLRAVVPWDAGAMFTEEYRLIPHADSVADARWHVRKALGSQTDPGTLGDVELVVSELVTNALRHGPGKLITLRLAAGDGSICGEVVDNGQGVVAMSDEGRGPADGGMGLRIVDELTSEWGVRPGPTQVWFRFDAA